MKSKTEIIKDFYRKYPKRGLTVLDGYNRFATTELRKLISLINQEKGWKIEGVWTKGKDRFGEPTNFKKYFAIKIIF